MRKCAVLNAQNGDSQIKKPLVGIRHARHLSSRQLHPFGRGTRFTVYEYTCGNASTSPTRMMCRLGTNRKQRTLLGTAQNSEAAAVAWRVVTLGRQPMLRGDFAWSRDRCVDYTSLVGGVLIKAISGSSLCPSV